ncbi:CRISPR-associated endoribonuclease Cas6 [Clostridium punense]|uniref:CRISPR-associated endoribonuclease Cas6 n=1 Tax=Clostridium punense TaxID=1054297 RepID=A0ABS4K8L0_9CLOT|nr:MULTISPECIES: CRISPR-associated endoribonuclease Cas6 [Clostridium]EQB88076.1 hypothetical protein M918_05925 [Clostridium sp. BL8]MBP2022939.1 CRISPR-associated endoribonuclease Cas6 [Clostridium punense]
MKDLNVLELNLKVYVLKNIRSNEALAKIAELIDKSLARESDFLEFHNKNMFKGYCFNSLFPLEDNGVYKNGRVYNIKIRTINRELAQHFKKYLCDEKTECLKSLTIEEKTLPQKHIEKIYSITPCVIKTDMGYWRGNLSLADYENRIKSNLIKKYNQFLQTELEEKFPVYNFISFDNKKPVSTVVKNVELLGDKVTLVISDDEESQKLAYLALGTGIGESNSRGFGFVNFRCL